MTRHGLRLASANIADVVQVTVDRGGANGHPNVDAVVRRAIDGTDGASGLVRGLGGVLAASGLVRGVGRRILRLAFKLAQGVGSAGNGVVGGLGAVCLRAGTAAGRSWGTKGVGNRRGRRNRTLSDIFSLALG